MGNSAMHAASRPLSYIPEIDLLRALAVWAVVAYHAAEPLAPGGFIGVDVFFVVSGYVIARRYLDALITRETSLIQFWIARFRRLALPAAAVLLISTFAAVIVLKPSDLIRYANSLFAQPFYFQNFVFWDEGDYFHRALEKPLLHTWSLAVEEQFYLFFALFIVILRRRSQLFVPFLMLVALGSVATGVLLEPRSPKTVFYMLPTRIWEFSLGIIAYRYSQSISVPPVFVSNIVSTIGLVYLAAASIVFTAETTFPGAHALSACMVTAMLLVIFDRHSSQLWGFFRQPQVLYVGQVSYSFYLWHWPPLAFFFIAMGRPASLVEATGLMFLAFILASLTSRFIERPVRDKRMLVSTPRLLGSVALVGVLSILVSVLIISTTGLLIRYPAEVRLFFLAEAEKETARCSKLYTLQNPKSESCALQVEETASGGVLVIGDSMAAMAKETIARVAANAGKSAWLTTRNCDLGQFNAGRGFCAPRVLDRVLSEAKARGADTVLAISMWETSPATAETFAKDVHKIVDMGFRVYVMETIPQDPKYAPDLRAEAALRGEMDLDGLSRSTYDERIAPTRTHMEPTLASVGAVLLRPRDVLCTDETCLYALNGKPIYFDAEHLTPTGADLLAPLLEKVFQ